MSPPRWIPSAACSASREFPATAAGYAGLLRLAGRVPDVALVGIEGTGSYGAGLARHVAAARHPGGRGGPLGPADRAGRASLIRWNAVSAARAAQSGRARGAPKGRDGAVEAIRALMVARRSAAGERTRTINQARALILTGPDDLRARFTRHTPAALVTGLASLRPRPGDVAGYAVRVALRELGRRAQFLDGQLGRLDELIVPLVTTRAPGLLTVYRARPAHGGAAAHRGRRSPRAAAQRGGLGAPVRRRPDPPRHRGKSPATGSTPAVTARPTIPLWRIVFTRLGSDPAARASRRAPHRRREIQGGDHPLPEALRRPRGLPPPPPGRRLAPSSGDGLTR